jgi:hypothetical protein
MLVLDAYRGHLTESVTKEVKKLNTNLVIILGGMTSQLLQVIPKPFIRFEPQNNTQQIHNKQTHKL